jgi:hypothetical protein
MYRSHALIPRGLKLDASSTSLTIGNSMAEYCAHQSLSAAPDEGAQRVALAQRLMESDAVFALMQYLLCCGRHRHHPGENAGLTIRDYLVFLDVQRPRYRLIHRFMKLNSQIGLRPNYNARMDLKRGFRSDEKAARARRSIVMEFCVTGHE